MHMVHYTHRQNTHVHKKRHIFQRKCTRQETMNNKLSDWLQYRAKLIVSVQDPVSVLTTDMFTSANGGGSSCSKSQAHNLRSEC